MPADVLPIGGLRQGGDQNGPMLSGGGAQTPLGPMGRRRRRRGWLRVAFFVCFFFLLWAELVIGGKQRGKQIIIITGAGFVCGGRQAAVAAGETRTTLTVARERRQAGRRVGEWASVVRYGGYGGYVGTVGRE